VACRHVSNAAREAGLERGEVDRERHDLHVGAGGETAPDVGALGVRPEVAYETDAETRDRGHVAGRRVTEVPERKSRPHATVRPSLVA
jgi:hypothetical protein